MSEDNLEDVREQFSDTGDRIDSAQDDTPQRELVDMLTEELARLEEGGSQKTVSVWDGEMFALLNALEDRPDLRAELGDALGGDAENYERSDLGRLAFRAGLQERAPEFIDALREAVRENATRDL